MTTWKILAVDDNETNLKLVRVLLNDPRYELHTAVNAHETLRILDSFLPDLILLDIQLPDMDGLELARRLRSDPRTRSIPIVAVTAYAMKGDEEKARAAGVDDYVCKPIEKKSFRATVARYLTERER